MIVATTFGFVGIAVYFSSNQAFSMLSVSDRYAVATSDAQRTFVQVAGESLLAIHNPGDITQGAGVHLALFLVLFSGLLIYYHVARSCI